jgi:16S rRNA (cytosine967-C5)-methyltransferase
VSAPFRRARRRAPPAARELALQILVAAESRSAYSDRLLQSRLRDTSPAPEEARLVTALVQGVLRRRATIDHHLSALSGANWERLPPAIRTALRLGAFQLLYLTRVPASAAVGESVALAKRHGHPGTAGLVNAVLRKLSSGARAPLPDATVDPVGRLAVEHSHPAWIVRRWLKRHGQETAERWLVADNEEPRVSVRASAGRISTEALAKRLAEAGHQPSPGPNGGPVLVLSGGFVAASSPLFREGLLSLQDEAESVVVAVLDPRPGEHVLDLCAAPGGKAAQIAERVAPDGRVVAVERHRSRAAALRENLLGRLGLPCVDVVSADGTAPPFARAFDRVLLDAPCSGLGVLRRRADARWRKEESVVGAMAALQGSLLTRAAGLTRPGGVLVYSVCSLEPEETDEIVSSFLAANREWTREDAGPLLPPAFRGPEPVLRATPFGHGTDGVFAVRLRRG